MPLTVSADFSVASARVGTGPVGATELNDGRYVIVWPTGSEILARFLNPDGTLSREIVAARAPSGGSVTGGSAEVLDDGRIVVSWTSRATFPVNEIKARVFLPDGRAATPEFAIADKNPGFPWPESQIVKLPGGRFLVTWNSNEGAPADFYPANSVVRARIFNADGTAAGDSFVASTNPSGFDDGVMAAALTNGNVVLAWEGPDGAHVRIVSGSGLPVSADLRAVPGDGNDIAPNVAALTNGKFLLTWSAHNQVTGDVDIKARLYNANGSVAGRDFTVNSTTSGEQSGSDVLALSNGGFVVAWQSQEGTNGFDIRARVYNANGVAVDVDFLVNSSRAADQIAVQLTELKNGKIAVVWYSLTGTIPNIRSAIIDLGDILNNPPINGTSGNDTLNGGVNDDIVSGFGGNDALNGFAGNDTLNGGDGDDKLAGGAGSDRLDGGNGSDTASYADEGQLTLSLDNSFVAAGSAAGDTLISIESLEGSNTGNDTLGGDRNANTLSGLGGNDVLYGRSGMDVLRGGAGDDLLIGGAGGDTLDGGLGNDRYRLYVVTDAGDTIVAFAAGDKIELKASVFGGLAKGALNATNFWSSASNLAHDADDRFIFRTTDKTLWFDSNGSAAGGSQLLLVDLANSYNLTAADIVLI